MRYYSLAIGLIVSSVLKSPIHNECDTFDKKRNFIFHVGAMCVYK